MSTQCPCCSDSLLRHWKNNQTYWFCRRCRQEMPNFEAIERKSYYHRQEQVLTDSVSISHQLATVSSSK